jgi:hypothetical protein
MSEALIKADSFHPMRGHVADGVKVGFQDGSVLTVTSSMRGWTLIDESGLQRSPPTQDAIELTATIVKIEAACQAVVV